MSDFLVLHVYQSTLVAGFGLPLGDALALERERAAIQYKSLTKDVFSDAHASLIGTGGRSKL